MVTSKPHVASMQGTQQMLEGNDTVRSLADLVCVCATEPVNPTTWPRKAGLAGGKELSAEGPRCRFLRQQSRIMSTR